MRTPQRRCNILSIVRTLFVPTQAGNTGRPLLFAIITTTLDSMAHRFNHGKPYHGSKAVSNGNLRGQTDSDYFYFLCPKCPDNTVLQIQDFDIVKDGPVEYSRETRPGAKRDFVIEFKLRCHTCKLVDFLYGPNGELLKTLMIEQSTTVR